MSTPRTCVVLAFDSGMYVQGKKCIERIREFESRYHPEINVLDLGLNAAERQSLELIGVKISNAASRVPNYVGAPEYARAMTCRPYLRDLFPGYEVYVWIDADIRVAAHDGLETYIDMASRFPDRVAITQEVD